MPGLLSVSDSSSSDWLLALYTLHSELLLVAGHTEILIVLGNETLRSNGLLAPMADKTGLMPAASLVFHFPCPWHDGLFAFTTLGGIFIGVTFSTKKVLFLCSKRLVHQ